MKKTFKIFGVIAIAALMACNSNKMSENSDSTTVDSSMAMEESTTSSTSAAVVPGTYVDLSSGKEVQIIADPQSGYAINSQTRAPLEFYVNTSTRDTIYRTGVVVNSAIMRDGTTWRLNDDMIERDGDNIKVKTEGDGDIKIKNETTGTKTKIEADGDTKIKTPTTKTKIDEDGEVKTKPRN
ncbi:MAG TPA: hypothetical protein VNI52_12615 [Sphingobacteriaceae bacterium]|nr:hypothetical protein [Sphingobacteriaceae bacterium]